MSDDMVIGGRTFYKGKGEWRMRAMKGSVYDPHVDEYCSLLDEIERLRKELATEQTYVMLSKADFNELLKIVKLFADNGKCLMHEEQFGYCTCSPCEWHEAEHMWESFCFARGI